jgi:glycosyltransferase involved in cell wall biosynthesis
MMSSRSPTVSVIVCTCNRHELLQRAIASVLRQDFQDFELIVLDDGSEPRIGLRENLSGPIRLIRTAHQGVGAARSHALEAARGEFIAYCDDDDEWTPNHLSTLLSYIKDQREIALVYADSQWAEDVPYSADYDAFDLRMGNYIFASDVLHRAAAAREAGGFDPTLQAYEDWDLWLRMSRRYLIRHLPTVLGFHHWTDDCVSAAGPWQEWQRVYERHRDGHPGDKPPGHSRCLPAVGFDKSTWRNGRRELIWHSVMRSTHSFGCVARQLLLALERLGVAITMAPCGNQAPPGFERFYKPLDSLSRMAFHYHYSYRPSEIKCPRVVTYIMWESTAVPQEQVSEINRAAKLLCVPCRQNMESYKDSGVTVPIKVLHHGVDHRQFPYLERPRRQTYTFGSFGDFSARKGIDILIRAFQDEFLPGEAVRLVLKSTVRPPAYAVKDPRVTVFSAFLDPAGLVTFLHGLDAFILPSRGEGFGLCALEAMSTGLPVIATNWSGPAEYMNPEYSFPLSFHLVDAQGTESKNIRHFGQWAEPDYDHLRFLLRWLYEHAAEAADKGRAAAQRVREHWTWERVAAQLVQNLDELAQA